MNRLNYLYGKHSKGGLTLLEVITVITLIFIVSAILLKLTFPKEEDLRKKDPKEALESIIKMAREVSNREVKEVRVQFIEQSMPIKISDNPNTNFQLTQSNSDRQKSILNFLAEIVTSPPRIWPINNYSSITKTPLFLLTDTAGSAVFDGDKVCYATLRNPGKDQLTMGTHDAFAKGNIDPSGKWKNNGTPSRQYFTVYPSGVCDSVRFKGEMCPEYNHDYVVDSIAGTVKKI